MKRLPFLLLGFFFANILQAQEIKEPFLSAKLAPGYPTEISRFVESLPNVKSAPLETGLDSLKVYFGAFSPNNGNGYWASLHYNNRKEFQMGELQASDSSEMLTEVLEFKFNNASMKVSVRVHYNPKTEEVFYVWMDKEGGSKTASVQKVQSLIEKNAAMPHLSVEKLKGGNLVLGDYKGKYLVINW